MAGKPLPYELVRSGCRGCVYSVSGPERVLVARVEWSGESQTVRYVGPDGDAFWVWALHLNKVDDRVWCRFWDGRLRKADSWAWQPDMLAFV